MRPSRQPLTLALVLGALIAAPAIAQQPSSVYPPACEASKVSKSDVERAHTVFLSGKQFLEESNYDKAISYFKDAYSIDCSIHAILPIIATAYERKGDRAEAVRALEEYQKRSPTASDHDVMERRIRNLKDQLAREQPSATAPATTAPAPPPPPPAPSATAGTAPSAAASAVPTVAPSGTASPPPVSEVGHTAGPWILVGAGGVALVAGVVAYVVGAGDVSSAETNCPMHVCKTGDMNSVSQGNDGRNLELAGGILMAVGAAGAALGVVWHFGEHGTASSGVAHAAPIVGPGFAGMGVGGTF